MPKSTVVYISNSYLPEINLAFEEYLMENLDAGVSALFLWQNQNTIVIGRHQNPLQECNLHSLEMDQVRLVRRLSGGGAVYQDLGNLNFTFIEDRENYNVEKQMNIILDALSSFGINGELNGQSNLEVSGKKFSGNAFFSQREKHCHHGTLLVDVNVDKLYDYLTASDLKIKSKSVDSVKSRVVNLKNLNPDIDINGLKQAIIKSFDMVHGVESDIIYIDQKLVEECMGEIIKKYRSEKWNYSKSPAFEIKIEEKFSWGIFDVRLNVINGLVGECKINTDAIIMDSFQLLQEQLIGSPLDANVFKEKIDKSIKNTQIREDVWGCFSGWIILRAST